MNNQEVQKFAQYIFRYGKTGKEMGINTEQIFSALHSALDKINVPQGEERATYLGVDVEGNPHATQSK